GCACSAGRVSTWLSPPSGGTRNGRILPPIPDAIACLNSACTRLFQRLPDVTDSVLRCKTQDSDAPAGPLRGPERRVALSQWASERVARHTHPAFHQDAGAAAHDGLGDRPLAIHLPGL